jgi:proteasome lid subunit RPN8/RPN11
VADAQVVRASVVDAIVAHAREAAPIECCGLLLGHPAAGVVESVRARNLAASPTRYAIDPADHIRARREARERGLAVIGFYHSHPHGSAAASPTDIAEAAYPGAYYLVVGLADAVPDIRLFKYDGGFVPVPLDGDRR